MRQPNNQETKVQSEQPIAKEKRPYSAPCLEYYGDIRGVTLGGSPGLLDSCMDCPTKPF